MTDVKRKRRRAAPAGIAPSEPERDILDQYLYEVSTYPLLKGAEEIELAKKIRAELAATAYPTTYVFGADGRLQVTVTGGISEQRLAAVIENALQ